MLGAFRSGLLEQSVDLDCMDTGTRPQKKMLATVAASSDHTNYAEPEVLSTLRCCTGLCANCSLLQLHVGCLSPHATDSFNMATFRFLLILHRASFCVVVQYQGHWAKQKKRQRVPSHGTDR